MKTAFPALRPCLATAALLTSAAAPFAHGAQELAAGAGQRDIADYQRAIAEIEGSQGAYGAHLSEPLLGLGMALQAQGRHDEAIALFKRGVHLTRVNEGLYSTRQIPLLQGEINSHIALGNYGTADVRQRYLYRVQLRGIDGGEPLTNAYMQQASWQYDAYRLGVGPYDYARLMNMWDLYRLALNDVISREGETSPDLIAPLEGMLRTQYLIAGYQWEDRPATGDDVRARQQLHLFSAYKAQSYEKGSVVIRALRSVEQEQPVTPQRQLDAARALVMLGDWHLYHDEREEAFTAYRQAHAELAGLGDAQAEVGKLFGEPVALPDIDGLRELPRVDPEDGNLLVQFTVNERGRTRDIERLDDNEAIDGGANRLLRQLRKTRFRPRFEQGEAVETQNVVRAYRLQ